MFRYQIAPKPAFKQWRELTVYSILWAAVFIYIVLYMLKIITLMPCDTLFSFVENNMGISYFFQWLYAHAIMTP